MNIAFRHNSASLCSPMVHTRGAQSDRRRRGWAAAALAVVFAAGLSACGPAGHPQQQFLTTDITGVDWGKGFDLIDHHGAPRKLDDFRGKVVMLFFGYTRCPDMCPVTLSKMAQVLDRLGTEKSHVQGLFITVDPKRDTPEVLAQYVPAFHATLLGLTGTESQTTAAAKDFKVFFATHQDASGEQVSIEHNAAMFIFDRQGRIRLYVSGEASVDAIVHDIKVLLGNSA